MLVYGDRSETADARAVVDWIAGELARVGAMSAGLQRHATLLGALIRTGQLVQAAADAEQLEEPLSAFLCDLARNVLQSWDSGFTRMGDLPAVPELHLARWIEMREPEGFAFYAVYPEAYMAAARKLRLLGPPRVIAIRSIGTTLGALVAAALGSRPPVTVRPYGDAFRRRARLPPEAFEDHAHYVIVDEGPGLSGSSFGCVADSLEEHGVPLERIALLPSHDGDLGPEASAKHLERWRKVQRVAAEFDPSFLVERFGPLERLSVGERLKYLAGRDGDRVLLKFAGLGRIGERKLQMARALHAGGFTPQPFDLVHGFLVERWHEDARPLGEADKPVDEIGRYIGARARLFRASPSNGATVRDLLAMCRRNLSLSLGAEAARVADGWNEGRLCAAVVPVYTDNKLDACEWLRMPDGRLLKSDAVDHHRAHDLIGCQDMAWDVAGAIAEFELGAAKARQLVEAVEGASARRVDPYLLSFYQLAYCCFRLGQATLANQQEQASRYCDLLRYDLHQHDCPATPQESSVD